MESEIVACIQNSSSRENCSFKSQFFPRVCPSKGGLPRHEKAKHQQHTTLDNIIHSDSFVLKSRLKLTDFSLMYEKSAQKLSTDECYPENVTEEFQNFSASLNNLMRHHKFILAVVNSFSRDAEKFMQI